MSVVCSLVPTVVVLGGLYDGSSGLNMLLPALGRLQRERPVRVLWGVPELPPREVELLGDFEPVLIKTPGDIVHVIRQADILALGHQSDQARRLAMTAMACGTAVVALDSPGIHELCVNGANALVVARQDGGALLGAVRTVLSDRTLRRRLVRAGLREAGQ